MIRYMPRLDSLLWSLKSIEYFDSTDELKKFIADQRTHFYRYVGRPAVVRARDIIIERMCDKDLITGWTNCHSIMIDGKIVGFYGE